MGEMFRRYWLPALLAEELPENDCPPVRVKLLSERLVAFRDTDGRYGLIDEFCAHRGVSLWFGRNEEGGLRCPYHGWKYDVDRPVHRRAVGAGEVRLLPQGQAEVLSAGRARRRPVDLHGPARARSRALPEWEFAHGAGRSAASPPSARRNATGCRRWKAASTRATSRSCIAASSTPIRSSRAPRATQYNLADAKPHFEVVESPGGLYIGARRNAENGNYYWRITQWVMPCFTMIPPRGDHPVHGHFWVPIDDENCWAWSFDYRVHRAADAGAARGHARTARASTSRTCPAPTARPPTRTTTT